MEREDNTKRKKGSIFELSGVPGFYESFPLALQHVVAMDAARSTIRLGVAKVRIVYRRREEDMAALWGRP